MPEMIEQEILMQEENLTQAQRQLDVSALDRIFADDVLLPKDQRVAEAE